MTPVVASGPGAGNLEPLTVTPPTVSAHRAFEVTAESGTTSSFDSRAGATIVVFASVYGSSTVSLSDASHDTFSTLASEKLHSPVSLSSLWIFVAYNVAKNEHNTVTATLSSSTNIAAVDAVEVTGVGASPLDHLGIPSNYSSAKNPLDASTMVPASAADLVLGVVAAHTARTWTPATTDTLLNDEHTTVSRKSMTAADFSSEAAKTGNAWINATTTGSKTYWIADGLSLRSPSTSGPYTVTFSESGLPTSHPWYVVLGGSVNSSTTSRIGFSVGDGTYRYSVSPISGVVATSASGSVTVSGAAKKVAINFKSDTNDWPTYLGNVQRDAANYPEKTLSSADAANLTLLWTASTGGIQAEPTVANGVVYQGADSGNEYALNAANGSTIWKTYLGQVLQPVCNQYSLGVTSAPTVTGGRVYVGGGNISGTGNISNGLTGFYALNQSTGKIERVVPVGNISQGSYNWASPLIADGYAYIGNASRCDDPLVWGGVLQVSLTTHRVVGFFNTTVGSKYRGVSVWSSPTFDPATNTVYITTGNPRRNYTSNYSESMVAFNATTLAPIGSWQVPYTQRVKDSDFGATPTFYTLPNGTSMVAAQNKNGITYAFRANNITAGPVWETALSYSAYPQNVAPLASGGGLLFNGNGPTNVNGKNYSGSVHALYPNNGTVKWQYGMPGDVYGAPVYTNGVVVAAGGDDLVVFNASTGAVLWKWQCGRVFYSAPAVAEGRIYIGCNETYAFGFTGTVTGPAAPTPELSSGRPSVPPSSLGSLPTSGLVSPAPPMAVPRLQVAGTARIPLRPPH